MSKTNRGLVFSGFAIGFVLLALIATSLTLLIAPLLAGGKVHAGTLLIEAFAYAADSEGHVDLNTQRDLSSDSIPIISKEDWLSDGSRVKFLEVRNKGDVAARVSFDFKVTQDTMQDSLWYDFNQVDEQWNHTEEPARKPMSTLTAINSIYVYTLEPQQVLRLKLEFGVDDAQVTPQSLDFEADAVVKVSQVSAMDKVVKVYDAVDFLTRNDHPTYVLMRNISGNVELDGLADIDLNGHTLSGNLTFGTTAPIQTAGTIHIGSASGGIITGKVTVNTPNAEVFHYGTASEVQIKASKGYRVYGEVVREIAVGAGDLTMERDAVAQSVILSGGIRSVVRIANNGVIRSLHAPVEDPAYQPIVTGNAPQVLTEGTIADVTAATAWDGELLTEPPQEKGVYIVSDAAQLAWIADAVNEEKVDKLAVRLAADIDLNQREWTPIGRYVPFQGTFDGGGYTISHLQIADTSECSGLFGLVKNAVIENVTIDSAALIEVNSYAGGLVGKSKGSTLRNCHVQHSAITGSAISVSVGGLVGLVEEGSFEARNCTVSDTGVAGYFDLGGLIGSCQADAGQKLLLASCKVEEIMVTAVPYRGSVEAWEGKFIQSHRFIGQIEADEPLARVTIRDCAVIDSADNGSPDTRIGSEELADWTARGLGDIRIQ